MNEPSESTCRTPVIADALGACKCARTHRHVSRSAAPATACRRGKCWRSPAPMRRHCAMRCTRYSTCRHSVLSLSKKGLDNAVGAGSQAAERSAYLARPDWGRRLDPESAAGLTTPQAAGHAGSGLRHCRWIVGYRSAAPCPAAAARLACATELALSSHRWSSPPRPGWRSPTKSGKSSVHVWS